MACINGNGRIMIRPYHQKESFMEQSLVSVVTIVFNDVAGIEKTIRSVVEQTYPNIEYIIIDGGSTDGTVDVIKKYNDKIAFWESKPDNGIYDAMNKGIMNASGKWINFMNSGDCFYDNQTIENCIECISTKSKNYKIAYGNFIWKNDHTENFVVAKSTIRLHYTMPSAHQSFLIDTQLHKKNLFDTGYKIAADFDFLCKMQHKGVRFLKMPVTISVYLAGGLSESMNDVKRKEFKEVFHKYNKSIQRFWYQHIVSLKLFDAGWRNYCFMNMIKRIIGEKNYEKAVAKIRPSKNRKS